MISLAVPFSDADRFDTLVVGLMSAMACESCLRYGSRGADHRFRARGGARFETWLPDQGDEGRGKPMQQFSFRKRQSGMMHLGPGELSCSGL